MDAGLPRLMMIPYGCVGLSPPFNEATWLKIAWLVTCLIGPLTAFPSKVILAGWCRGIGVSTAMPKDFQIANQKQCNAVMPTI